ncbi:TauD/TfdA family dioxygenase [Salinarimonas sp.]|uniref:TauD/TfdA family dioxygenase n=1 Tax=Salinarimonas sp. TaxID=2766526 RepID=UPI0032D8BFF7
MKTGPGAFRRRALQPNASDLVACRPLGDEGWWPALVTPQASGVDLVGWSATQRDLVADLLRRHKALLFRGFDRQSAAQLADFVAASSDNSLLDYKDRTTPREALGSKLYTSTSYPADRRIELHNEGTYWRRWPLKLYFACDVAAETGGETPLADMARVLDRLSPETVARFEASGFTLVRRYNDGFGLPWQEVFQTEDRAEVEAFCTANGIGYEWGEDDRLATRQTRPAIRRHPRTGERVWFNHAAFFHVSAYAGPDRDALEAELGSDRMPYATTFGDGSEIPVSVVDEILAAYHAEERRFAWEDGDILLVDNMSIAHGRQPYSGRRRVLVAMAEPHDG